MELELKRLQRQRLFTSEEISGSGSSSSGTPGSVCGTGTGHGLASKDQPLFTLKQVSPVQPVPIAVNFNLAIFN